MPKATFITDPSNSGIEDKSIRFVNTSSNSVDFLWDFGNGDSSRLFQPSTMYGDTGEYIITLISYNENGCSDTAKNHIFIKEKFNIYIPNAFTPNFDGNNDYFMIMGSGIKDYNLRIFHRNGALIFNNNSSNKYWDGLFEGEPLSLESYLYELTVFDNIGESHNYTGVVHLLR
jgi:gliding motility-associated-like protein